jgi:N2,N2-dimethylguanosine tRNA methyltransferase
VARPVPEGYASVTENSATVIHKDQSEVFYNPVQETNRDLSILVIKTFMKRFQRERQTAKGRKRRELVLSRSPVTTGPTAPSGWCACTLLLLLSSFCVPSSSSSKIYTWVLAFSLSLSLEFSLVYDCSGMLPISFSLLSSCSRMLPTLHGNVDAH